MITYRVSVEQEVLVTVDETKFDAAFMQEFRASFYPFETLEEHVRHVAQLHARGILSDSFVEGYGPPHEMGIVAESDDRGANFEVGEPEAVETSASHVSLVEAQRYRLREGPDMSESMFTEDEIARCKDAMTKPCPRGVLRLIASGRAIVELSHDKREVKIHSLDCRLIVDPEHPDHKMGIAGSWPLYRAGMIDDFCLVTKAGYALLEGRPE